ncbi:class I SAM-dependent methyltransferase [Jatrophihabitans sp.]|jgi:glycine/sarcosine N-methyltransferase|uniref:class I SAM-dependent methyltransferase n=1 Tax=Jatrophihabitans sp. TaxID=1932789 RepID=UPI002F15A12B
MTAQLVIDQYGQGFAARWDELVDWRRRLESEGDFLNRIVAGPSPGRALFDIACGTGVHAAHFAATGYQVDASDGSAEMVERARINLAASGTDIRIEQLPWEDLRPLSVPRYDAVVCLGSSMPHAGPDQRRALLRRIHDLLSVGGVLLVDHRNFDYIVDHQQMPPGRSVYAGNVDVSLVASDQATTSFGYRYADGFFRTLTVESLRFAQLRDDLRSAGFGHIDSFGDQRPVESADDSGFFLHRAVRTALD